MCLQAEAWNYLGAPINWSGHSCPLALMTFLLLCYCFSWCFAEIFGHPILNSLSFTLPHSPHFLPPLLHSPWFFPSLPSKIMKNTDTSHYLGVNYVQPIIKHFAFPLFNGHSKIMEAAFSQILEWEPEVDNAAETCLCSENKWMDKLYSHSRSVSFLTPWLSHMHFLSMSSSLHSLFCLSPYSLNCFVPSLGYLNCSNA